MDDRSDGADPTAVGRAKLPILVVVYGWALVLQGIVVGFRAGESDFGLVEPVISMLLGLGLLTRKRAALWLVRLSSGGIAALILFLAFLLVNDAGPLAEKAPVLAGYLGMFVLMVVICLYFTNSTAVDAAFRKDQPASGHEAEE